MQPSSCLRALCPAALLGALLIPSTALAHIDLIDPPARAHGTAAGTDPMIDVNTNQKSGPCGQVTNGRTTDRVTTYAPGETITIQVREETPHDSYIRVSLDLDGDNGFPVRPTTTAETQEVAQAAEEAIDTNDTLLVVVRESNGTPNFVHDIEVTLPDETCDTCTLQVTQFMYGAPNPYYYQCADLIIAEGGGEGGAGGSGSGGSASSGESGAAGSSAMTAGSGGAAQAGASSMAGTGGTLPGDDDNEEDEGCSIGSLPGSSSSSPALVGLLALGLGALARRRR
jgi:MYXO-CTERM domain-containing protein